jgi:hypothetical protein
MRTEVVPLVIGSGVKSTDAEQLSGFFRSIRQIDIPNDVDASR